MKRLVISQLWQRLLLTLLFTIHSSLFTAFAQGFSGYDADHPVIIVCNWDFPPYEFNNDDGQPDGFNVQLLTTIFNKIKVPFQFQPKEWLQTQETFEQREADLIIDPSYKFHGRPYILSRNVLNYYKVRIVAAPGVPLVHNLSQLTEADTLVLKENDYSTDRIVNERRLSVPIEYHSSMDAIQGISKGRYRYFVWGEYPLLWKMKTMAIDSLAMGETDIPDGEMRIVGYDKVLIDMIDDEFARLEQSGELEVMRDKWFHPERQHNDTSPVALFVLAGVIIATIIVLLMSRLIRVRVKQAVKKSNDINNMMTQAVTMGHLYVVEYDRQTRIGKNLYGDLLPDEGLSFDNILKRIHADDLDAFTKYVMAVAQGEHPEGRILIRWNVGKADAPEWRDLIGHASIDIDSRQQHFLTYSLRDITNEVKKERLNQELTRKYMKVFKTNLIAMSVYHSNGTLIDLNDKMRELCHFDEQGEQFFRNTNLFDIAIITHDFERKSHDQFHVCQHMHYPEIGIDQYVEFRVSPIFNDRDELAYYIFTARDVTAERTMYLEQRQHDEQLQQTNKAINVYEQQLQYLLEKSKMYVWRFTLKDMAIQFSRSLRKVDFAYTRDEYIKSMAQDEHANADQNLMEVMMKGKEFNTIHRFNHTPVNPAPCWYSLSGMPTCNAEGHVTGYFGVARDITELMDAQERLRHETARAEDSGRMKSAFLANMTHEIRTPLNAIVGFSDLLPLIDAPEERMEFIRIIRSNCDMLMRLINDILEASTMGQALAIEPKQVDFSHAFDDICQTLAQRVQEPGVEFQKDNPYASFITTLDKGRIQQVLTNFVTNAVKYTHEGHIRVGYRYEQRTTHDGRANANGLYFYCEDTGAGIPKEKQASVFERFVKLNDFVQGTGLGLSICKNIAERCNGSIGITSEGEGHGSTFWLWIPCEKIGN